MTQIAFVTLFLGLTMGVRPLEIRVTGPVHHVEIRLDGAMRAVIKAPPWDTAIDLGDHLLPHRLTAIAMDAEGRELARAEQMINVPRRYAETEIMLERSADGRPAKAHLLWQSANSDKARAASLTLDGKPLALDASLTADLANVDTSTPHTLRARVESPDGTIAETEIAFGALEAQTERTLTAVPVRVAEGVALTQATAQQRLKTPDGPADVVGIEELPADVIVVRDPSNAAAIGRLEHGRAAGPVPNSLEESSNAAVRHRRPQVRFVWPAQSAAAKELPTYLMPLTRPFEFGGAAELKAVLARVAAPSAPGRLMYADAVAVAGLRAASTQRPRAVVLLLGVQPHDDSELSPQKAREYLQAMNVPLFVWSLVPPAGAQEWGDVTDVSSPRAFGHAFDALNESLRSQRIVWINGAYLPTEIAVTQTGGGALQSRIDVHAIELTASVRDANGRVPRDLTPDDFVVLEDGKQQKVIGVDYTEATPRAGQVVVFIQQSLSSTEGLRLAVESLAAEAASVAAAGAVEVVTDYPRPHSLFGPTRDPAALRDFLRKLGNEITGEEEVLRIRAAAPIQPLNRIPLAPLTRLADATGGDVVTDAKNAGAELRQLSDRVVITFQTDSAANAALHPVEVTSRRPGLTIRTQKWAGKAQGDLPLTCSINPGFIVNGISTSEIKAHVDLAPITDVVAPDAQGSLEFKVTVTSGDEPPFTITRQAEHVELGAPDGYTATIGIRHRVDARITVVATEPSTGSWGSCVIGAR